jgi:DNA-binding CsgD family transcriptional regulator
MLRDFAAADAGSPELIEQGFIKSMLCGSLAFRGTLIGVLSIQDCTTMRDWNAEEIGIVRWFCTTVSMYISTIRMQTTMTSLGNHLMSGLKELAASSTQQGLSRTRYIQEIRSQTRAYDDGRFAHVFPALTKRERQVLLRLERSNKEIASELFTSHHTIKGHVNRLLRKLGVADRQAAIALAKRALARKALEDKAKPSDGVAAIGGLGEAFPAIPRG